jgi:hypothetical protein
VAGELLDNEDVGPTSQEVRDATPAEIVRSEGFQTGFAAAFPQNAPDPLAAQATKADAAGLVYVTEQWASARSGESEPVPNCLFCPVWHVHESVLPSFATEDGEFCRVLVVVGVVKIHGL